MGKKNEQDKADEIGILNSFLLCHESLLNDSFTINADNWASHRSHNTLYSTNVSYFYWNPLVLSETIIWELHILICIYLLLKETKSVPGRV